MDAQLRIERHPEVDRVIQALPQSLVDSLKLFEQRLECNGDLSKFINTRPFSSRDNVGKRTRIEHYHLLPCKPVCYLVGLVRSVDTAYILDIFVHPPRGTFASPEIEQRLYSRLADMCPEFRDYKLSGAFRSGFSVRMGDMYRTRSVKGVPVVTPVRASNSDYLPLGQLTNLSGEQSRVGIVVGTFEIPREEIQDEVLECFDHEDHPAMESLTLYIGGWQCHSRIYRKETEQLILAFCSLHHVIVQMSNRRDPTAVAYTEHDYQRIVDGLKSRFASIDGSEEELGEIVDALIRSFPLHRA